jgi:hypothetical protein
MRERFEIKWGIEFSASKCQFMVFGIRKYDNLIFNLTSFLNKLDYLKFFHV